MPKEIVNQKTPEINPQEITVSLRAANPSFLMFPTALFEIGNRFKWKARFLIGMGYLYALCFNGNTVKTTTKELKKVLSTKSDSRIYELFSEIETLNRLAVVEAEGKHPDKFVKWVRGKKGKSGRTEIELVLPQDLSYIYPDNKFFPVPKIAFLLPVSAQAKALYLYLHYLKDKETNRAVAGARKVARALRIDYARVSRFAKELVEKGVLSTKSSKQGTEFFVRSPVYWPDETLLEIAQDYSLSHPFLKEWSITLPQKLSNRTTPQKKSPIQQHQILLYNNTPPKNSPIEQHLKPAGESRPKAQESLTTSNKRITTSNKPTSNTNNGGGVANNIRNLASSEKENKESEGDKKNPPPKKDQKETAGKEIKEAQAAELGCPNKIAERLDREQLSAIKASLAELSEGVEEELRRAGLSREKLSPLYSPLKEIYGDLWWVLAGMYELLARKNGSGYNRRSNYNPVGLLISFALSDSPASFKDFKERFTYYYPTASRGAVKRLPVPEKCPSVKELKKFLKKKLPPNVYRLCVEEGIVGIENGRVKFKNEVVEELFVRKYRHLIEEFFSVFGR